MEVGDYIYCHTTGYFNGSSEKCDIFAVAGKDYTILTLSPSGEFTIRNEQGREGHVWDLIGEFGTYFHLSPPITPKKNKLKFKWKV